MKKTLLILGMCFISGAFAATIQNTAESGTVCLKLREQMRSNHVAIDKAFDTRDACTMGKLMIQNREIFESHPECFPMRARKMIAPQAAAAK